MQHAILSALVAAAACEVCAAQASFTILQTGQGLLGARPTLNGAGSVAAWSDQQDNRVTLWSGGTYTHIPLPAGSQGADTFLDADGDTVAFTVTGADWHLHAYTWSNATQLQPLPVAIGDADIAVFGISPNGQTISGRISLNGSYGSPFRWSQQQGLSVLSDPAPYYSIVTGVGDDGAVYFLDMTPPAVVASRWLPDGTVARRTGPGHPVEVNPGATPLMWANGNYFVEYPGGTLSITGPAGAGPVTWRDGDDAGTRIVGEGETLANGYIWENGQAWLLDDFVSQRLGLSLDGWHINSATSISDNGSVIVGTAFIPGRFDDASTAVFQLTIPSPGTGLALAALALGSCSRLRHARSCRSR